MDANALKQAAAQAALQHVVDGAVVGIGSGSTVGFFIRALGERRARVAGAVSSSERSTALLREQGIEVLPLERAGPIPVYVDGADEIDAGLRMIKGGGGALARE
jgi:ribose 5-phosphate isomerase A